jgi:hypothetical protein
LGCFAAQQQGQVVGLREKHEAQPTRDVLYKQVCLLNQVACLSISPGGTTLTTFADSGY